MDAKEFYNNQDRFKYFTKLTTTGISDDFDEIMAFAEAYHEAKLKSITIADIVEQATQKNNNLKEAVSEVVEILNSPGAPNLHYIKERLSEALK